MAIARKPNSSRSAALRGDPEKAASVFIQGAGKLPEPESRVIIGVGRKTPIMLRFDGELLRRVDLAAKRRGISRSAWIAFKVSEALDAEGT